MLEVLLGNVVGVVILLLGLWAWHRWENRRDHERWCGEQGIDPETLRPVEVCR